MNRYKVLIWGTGERTKRFIREGYFEELQIEGFVDSSAVDNTFDGYPLFRLEDVEKIFLYIDYIIISNRYYGEILETCLALQIPIDKIIITDNVNVPIYRKCVENLREIIPSIYHLVENNQVGLVKFNERDFTDVTTFYKDKKFKDIEYRQDYFRYRTYEFVCEEIKRENVDGAIAELGVFRGTFSALLNEKFKERKLYLFDTFEGFRDEEAKEEIEKGHCDESFIMSHKDTSVEKMLSNLPYPEKAIVCKGYFPQSITEVEEKETFAFVSLDVDFEESTYQGLKFFYPRMNDGGYIFVHDYNTYYLEGVKAAVERYESELGVKLKRVPLADRAGTLVIVK